MNSTHRLLMACFRDPRSIKKRKSGFYFERAKSIPFSLFKSEGPRRYEFDLFKCTNSEFHTITHRDPVCPFCSYPTTKAGKVKISSNDRIEFETKLTTEEAIGVLIDFMIRYMKVPFKEGRNKHIPVFQDYFLGEIEYLEVKDHISLTGTEFLESFLKSVDINQVVAYDKNGKKLVFKGKDARALLEKSGAVKIKTIQGKVSSTERLLFFVKDCDVIIYCKPETFRNVIDDIRRNYPEDLARRIIADISDKNISKIELRLTKKACDRFKRLVGKNFAYIGIPVDKQNEWKVRYPRLNLIEVAGRCIREIMGSYYHPLSELLKNYPITEAKFETIPVPIATVSKEIFKKLKARCPICEGKMQSLPIYTIGIGENSLCPNTFSTSFCPACRYAGGDAQSVIISFRNMMISKVSK